jgi:hypothetical protein
MADPQPYIMNPRAVRLRLWGRVASEAVLLLIGNAQPRQEKVSIPLSRSFVGFPASVGSIWSRQSRRLSRP